MYNTVVIDFLFVFCYLALISSIYCKHELWFLMPNWNKVNNNNNNKILPLPYFEGSDFKSDICFQKFSDQIPKSAHFWPKCRATRNNSILLRFTTHLEKAFLFFVNHSKYYGLGCYFFFIFYFFIIVFMKMLMATINLSIL